MENEYFDEPRKCPNCSIVTYCDSCPTCGRRLPRSSSNQWKRLYGHRIAGEEAGILQPGDLDGKQKHINIRDSQSGNQSFESAKHREPNISFDGSFDRSYHPFIKSGEVKKANNRNSLFVIILVIVVVAIFITLISVGVKRMNFFTEENTSSISQIHHGIIDENMNSIQLSNYVYDSHNEEATFLLENTGEQTFSTTIEFYEENQKRWSEYNVFILPNESFEYTIYIRDHIDSYSFVDYEFHDISAIKPSFDYRIFNDYGNVVIDTMAMDLQKEEIQILTTYLIEATSYDDFTNINYINVYDGDGVTYEIYINNTIAEVSVYDENNVLDDYTINLDKEIGTKL